MLRDLKKRSKNIEDLWFSICREYDNFFLDKDASQLFKAEKAMLVVSTFFKFGNKSLKNNSLTGCVGMSEETDLKAIAVNFKLYRDSQIGCCNDFAYMTASFLNYLNIKNELIWLPGHIANLITINKTNYYIDSSTNIIVKNFNNERGKLFNIFPHPSVSLSSERYKVLCFQNHLIENFSRHSDFIFNKLKLTSTKDIDINYFH